MAESMRRPNGAVSARGYRDIEGIARPMVMSARHSRYGHGAPPAARHAGGPWKDANAGEGTPWRCLRKSSDQGIGEFLEGGGDQVRLLRPGAEGLAAAVDVGGVEAIGLGAHAVEGVIGDK